MNFRSLDLLILVLCSLKLIEITENVNLLTSYVLYLGNPLYDSLGSLGVGTLLGVVSAFLIYTNTEALLGRSIQPEQVQRLTELLENDPSVRSAYSSDAVKVYKNILRNRNARFVNTFKKRFWIPSLQNFLIYCFSEL